MKSPKSPGSKMPKKLVADLEESRGQIDIDSVHWKAKKKKIKKKITKPEAPKISKKLSGDVEEAATIAYLLAILFRQGDPNALEHVLGYLEDTVGHNGSLCKHLTARLAHLCRELGMELHESSLAAKDSERH